MSVRFTIGRAVGLFGFVVTLGCVAILVANMMAISQLKVGGPIYRQIVLGKDMIADILPPPEYVIEAYLESTLALNDPSSVATHKERLGQLRKDYDLRHEYWKGEAFDPTITKMLVEDSYYIDAFLQSVRIAGVSALICLVLGYPMAYAIARAQPTQRLVLLTQEAKADRGQFLRHARLKGVTELSVPADVLR